MKSLLLRQKKFRATETPNLAAKWIAALLACVIGLAHGEVRLNTDWPYKRRDDASDPLVQNEGERFRNAADAASYPRDAVASHGLHHSMRRLSGFKLFVNETKYFLQPSKFMTKSRPNEVCTPTSGPGLTYQCEEGQRLTSDCHLIFFDAKFVEAGFSTAVSRPKCNTRVIGLRAQLDESQPGFERRPATA